jgi:hypothetical protein
MGPARPASIQCSRLRSMRSARQGSALAEAHGRNPGKSAGTSRW